MASFEIRTSYEALAEDSERDARGFDPSLASSSEALLQAGNDEQRAAILGDWLKRHQPCLFAKAAVERGLIAYCFLNDADLRGSDHDVAQKIQSARTAWQALAEHGQKSAFIILAVSERLTKAAPNQALLRLARLICSHYLRSRVLVDRIYLDTLELWDVGYETRRRWGVGVNFFGAQGDIRWWNDHRIPGGIGFSMNSVGHLIASEARRDAIITAASKATGASPSKSEAKRRQARADLARAEQSLVNSFPAALRLAMRTILDASEQPDVGEQCHWQRATFLLRLEPGEQCPFDGVANDKKLSDKDYTGYAGWYHTDVTLPSEYFQQNWLRPSEIVAPYALDFTYLHDKRSQDFRDLATGRRVRERIGLPRGGMMDEEPDDISFVAPPVSLAPAAIPISSLTAEQVEEARGWVDERGYDIGGLAIENPTLFRALLIAPDGSGHPVVMRLQSLARDVAREAATDLDLKAAFAQGEAATMREARSVGMNADD